MYLILLMSAPAHSLTIQEINEHYHLPCLLPSPFFDPLNGNAKMVSHHFCQEVAEILPSSHHTTICRRSREGWC